MGASCLSMRRWRAWPPRCTFRILPPVLDALIAATATVNDMAVSHP